MIYIILFFKYQHTSSLEISSLLKVKPGINPLFFNQNNAAKLPEKNIPSTAANATNLSPKVALLSLIHLRAQSAFFFTHGMVSIALNKKSLYGKKIIIKTSHIPILRIINKKTNKCTFLLGPEYMYQLISYTFLNVYSPSLFGIHKNI